MDTFILAISGLWWLLLKTILGSWAVVGISYAVFVFLGKRFIEQKFSEKQIDFKHQKDKDLEKYRTEINSLLNRITKIHEKEFEVLPKAWSKACDCFNSLKEFIRILTQEIDLNKLNEEELDYFLEKNDILDEYQKKELKKQSDKLVYYRDIESKYDLNKVLDSFYDFTKYIERNWIFLSSDLKIKFQELKKVMIEVIADQKTGYELNNNKMKMDALNKMYVDKKIESVMEEIEVLVQKHLKYNEVS